MQCTTPQSRSRIGERVIDVLRKMGCPEPLQSNQIQGRDFNAMLPVVRWLVTRVLEHRKATGHTARAGSETHFDSEFSLPRVKAPKSTDFMHLVSTRYAPSRTYRRNASMWSGGLDAGARIACALLEYGEQIESGRLSGDSGADAVAGGAASEDKQLAKAQKVAAKAAQDAAARSAELQAELLAQMSGGGGGKLSGARVGDVMSLQADALRAESAQYAAREAALREAAAAGTLLANTAQGRSQAHRRRLAGLQHKVQAAQLKQQIAAQAASAARGRATQASSTLASKRSRIGKLQAALTKIADTVAATGQAVVFAKIEHLQRMKEQLGEQQRAFKSNCRRQVKALTAQLEALQAAAEAGGGGASGDAAQLAEVEASHAATVARHRRLRGMLARRNREMDRLQRLVDDVPSRPELLQYERRFMELYETMARQMDEMRKHYTTFNTLQKKREDVDNEESLLASMRDTFPSAMRSGRATEQFMGSVQAALDGLVAAKTEREGTLAAGRASLQGTQEQLALLKSAQRAYVKAVKDFTAACEANEDMVARLEAAGVQPRE